MFETVSQIVRHIEKKHDKPDLIESKIQGRFQPISTKAFIERVKTIAGGLHRMGLKAGDRVAVLAPNSPDWIMTDLAVICCGAVTVPIYPTLTAEQIRYILDDSGARMVAYSGGDLWGKLDELRSRLRAVERFICFRQVGSEEGTGLDDIVAQGREFITENPKWFDKSVESVQPDSLASIIYTSGTTGEPKGVMLTHANFVSNILALRSIIEFTSDDRCLSFLPLSHVLERMCTFAFLSQGTGISYAESVERVAANLVEVRPTIMVSVPRLFEKIYAGVMDNILSASIVKRRFFFRAVEIGRIRGMKLMKGERISRSLQIRHALARRLVFNRILERTGGRIRFFVSGGAPLAKDIAEFFYSLGLIVLEGYGLTETSPVVAVNTLEEPKFGSVGRMVPGVEVKIADDGEILVRGPNVMKGYHNRPLETKEAMAHGWFHTGDIGHLDEDGFLYITDRKKDIIVTAGGKNVAPQVIENIIKASPYIAGVVVVGARRKFISAVIVPEFDKLKAHARETGISYENTEDLVKNPEIRQFLMREIERSSGGLAPFERIKKIVVLPREFDLAENEITPTMKIKRHIVETRYRSEIDGLYTD